MNKNKKSFKEWIHSKLYTAETAGILNHLTLEINNNQVSKDFHFEI